MMWHRQPQGPFSDEVLRDAAVHATETPQREACGVVVDGVYTRCGNVHPNPERTFRIAPDVVDPLIANGTLQGIIHSHPDGTPHPSEADMAGQIATDVPWAIVVPGGEGQPGDVGSIWGTPRPALFDDSGDHVQRAFCHGVYDCYEMIRDWYREQGSPLPAVARADEWWRSRGSSIYLDMLEEIGAEVISTDPAEYPRIAQPGDVYLQDRKSVV